MFGRSGTWPPPHLGFTDIIGLCAAAPRSKSPAWPRSIWSRRY